jgi:tRNA (mo5U34)-methyltransferase
MDTRDNVGHGTAGHGKGTDDLAARVASFPYWYHRIELPGGVVTPGTSPHNPTAYRLPERLDGKRVLDVGAWDGYWTFEALRRGAREVVAIDDFSDYLGTLKSSDRKAWDTFDLCRDALGYSAEQCRRQEMSVYDVTEAQLGRFDVVFCFGTLYHLRHPLLGLDRLAAVCDEDLYVESAILDDFSAYRGGLGNGYAGGQIVTEFYPGAEYGGNASNWWVPTLHCMAFMVRAAGFTSVEGWKLVERPTHLSHCRGFVKGSRDGRA